MPHTKHQAWREMKRAGQMDRTGLVRVVSDDDAANEPASLDFSDDELLAGDLERLQRRDQRFRQTLDLVHEAELAYFRRMGML